MRKFLVPPSGNPEAKLVICGEQPGFHEIHNKPRPMPFVGPAGHGLNACLQMAGISRNEIYLTNVIKEGDHPLNYYIDLDSRGKYTISQDGWTYIKELGEELAALSPNIVVAMGNIALLALTNRVGITKWRGSVLESELVPGLKVIPTFHPATFIPPKFNFLNKPLIVFDLKRAVNEMSSPKINRTLRHVYIKPNFEQSIGWLDHCYALGLKNMVIDIDIEVLNEEVDCFAVAILPTETMSIPLRDHNGDYLSPEQELAVMRRLGHILEDERIAKRGANFIFDTQFLLRRYGFRPRGRLHCTQIAQKIALPDYPAGLDFVTSMHTDIPYYKQDGKKWMKMGTGSWEQWWNYNGMDTLATAAAHPHQIDDLRSQGNELTYERQCKLIPPLIYMMERGIRVDTEGIVAQKEKEEKRLITLTEEFHKLVGRPINVNSPKQLMEYFYGDLKIQPYKSRNTKGQWTQTIDVDALKRIARRGFGGAKIMLEIRGLSTRLSRYLDVGKVDPDGRYRSAYKPVGAETGRLSSGETIFGTGGNQQNWPHDLLRYFLFDEGYIGYSFDLSQIENRIVAYVGGIVPMIDAFESGIDLHRLTTALIFGIPYDEVSDEAGSSPLGDGKHSQRFWGKKANHGLNYDLGYKSFALYYELPESEAKAVVDSYHRAYPGVRQGYHAYVRSQLMKDRTLTNLFGRVRLFMGPVIPAPPLIRESDCHTTYKEAYAQIPQSTTADKINEQGIEYIYYNQEIFHPVELLNQIHDSIGFQIHLSIPWRQHAEILLSIKRSLETPLEWMGNRFVVPADLAIGFNLCKEDMRDFKSRKIPNDVTQLADLLEKTYIDLKEAKNAANAGKA